MARRRRLEELTRRWQDRRDARRRLLDSAGTQREAADPVRAARAASAFPFRRMTPAEYVARHGSDMVGFSYDDYTYSDAALQAWLDEVGRLLRLRVKAPLESEVPKTSQEQDR
jgi:hypothetical protein